MNSKTEDGKEVKPMKNFYFNMLILLVLLVSSCAPALATEQPVQNATPTVEIAPTIPVPTEAFQPMNLVRIPAPSLENNLVDETAERDIYVYFPLINFINASNTCGSNCAPEFSRIKLMALALGQAGR